MWIEAGKLLSRNSVYTSSEKKIKIRDETVVSRALVEPVWTPVFVDTCSHVSVFATIRRAVCTKGLTLCPVVTIIDQNWIVVAGPNRVKYAVYLEVTVNGLT